MAERLKLYVDANFLSPYAMSAYVGLQEKGLPFDIARIDLGAREQHAPSYAAVSLTRRVPTLVHGEFRLSESSAITEYLDERFPAPTHAALYPQAPELRAKAREIQAWLRSDLAALRQERTTEVVFKGWQGKPLSEAAQAAAAKLFTAATVLLQHGGQNLFGAWSIVDADLALMLNRLVLNGDEMPSQLADYARLQWQRDSIQAWLGLGRQAHASSGNR